MKQKYYLDTCIWLNLFKKEGDITKGVPYWKIAQGFIEKVKFSQNKKIAYSNFVLKELRFNLDEGTYNEKKKFFEKERFRFVKEKAEDYFLARKLESQFSYEISFFDCLHLAICKRLNFILITRDKGLIRLAKESVAVAKPEDLFI